MPQQSFKKHAAIDPLHMTIVLVFFINVIVTIVEVVTILRNFFHFHAMQPAPFSVEATLVARLVFQVIVTIALVLLAFKTRANALKVQDRVIRLEERVRFATLLPQPLLAESSALTPGQIIGLRFASDAELPALVQRTLTENLTRKQIKAAITEWRADHFRL